MSRLILDLAMSLDGYIAGERDEIDWLADYNPEDYNFEELLSSTGSILMGARSYELGVKQGWFKDNAYGPLPIVVVCKEAPQQQSSDAEFHFVSAGLDHAVAKAVELAQGKHVYVFGGASIAQQLINKQQLDEIHIGIVPILLGGGIRLFDNLDHKRVKLERFKVEEQPKGLTGIYYKVMY